MRETRRQWVSSSIQFIFCHRQPETRRRYSCLYQGRRFLYPLQPEQGSLCALRCFLSYLFDLLKSQVPSVEELAAEEQVRKHCKAQRLPCPISTEMLWGICRISLQNRYHTELDLKRNLNKTFTGKTRLYEYCTCFFGVHVAKQRSDCRKQRHKLLLHLPSWWWRARSRLQYAMSPTKAEVGHGQPGQPEWIWHCKGHPEEKSTLLGCQLYHPPLSPRKNPSRNIIL